MVGITATRFVNKQTYKGSSTQDDFIPRDSICFCRALTENVPHLSL